jgi:geranylgeranyl diphosphate synthase type I
LTPDDFAVVKVMPYKDLELFLTKYSKMVEPEILRLLTSYVSREHHGLVKYQILAGGKRLRPALAIICCQMVGGTMKDILYPAAGLEILHNYTLIVDDIIDHSRLRRRKPTLWAKFGRSVAECIAVAYSAALFQAAGRAKNPIKVSELFVRTLKTIMDGEILDILFEQSGRVEEPYVVKNRYYNITEKNYFKMASKKTAVLFEICCQVGGIAACATKKQLSALRNYGFNLGMVFQITDDILDIFGKEKEFGKVIGGDIAERKLGNIVMLYALKELELADRKRFLRILRKEKINKSNIKEAVGIIKKTNSRQKAEILAKKFSEKAKIQLNYLPQNRWNKLLSEIADFILTREN